jgi:hypothetical protein
LALCSTPVTNSRSNETLLFSIIKPVDIDLVAKKGFVKADEFFCRKQFGRGIYFTDNALNGAASVRSLYFLLTIRSTRPIVRLLRAWHGIHAARRQGRAWQPCYSHEGCTRLCCFYKTQNPQNPLLSSLQENTELSGPPQPQRTYAKKSGAQTPASYHSVLAESRTYGGSLPWRL